MEEIHEQQTQIVKPVHRKRIQQVSTQDRKRSSFIKLIFTLMKKFFAFIKKPVGILSLLLVVALGACGYFYSQYHKLSVDPRAQSQADAQKKTDEMIAKISKLMVVSDTSNAVIATIADKSKLVGQKFFDNAQNGDVLVLLPNMSKAVIYRPLLDKIIDIGPFNPSAATSTPKNSAQSNPAPVATTTSKKK